MAVRQWHPAPQSTGLFFREHLSHGRRIFDHLGQREAVFCPIWVTGRRIFPTCPTSKRSGLQRACEPAAAMRSVLRARRACLRNAVPWKPSSFPLDETPATDIPTSSTPRRPGSPRRSGRASTALPKPPKRALRSSAGPGRRPGQLAGRRHRYRRGPPALESRHSANAERGSASSIPCSVIGPSSSRLKPA
jgi:hypothetical protein